MSALLMTLGVTAVFLLYRHLKRLQTEHAHMLRLIRQAPAALIWFDGKGRLIGANERFLTLSGYRLSQLRGQLWTERLLPSETALRLTHLLRTSDQKEITDFSASFIKADGDWLEVVLDIKFDNGLGITVVREAS